ncbi:hypothetical protein ACQPW3_21255 [Actinosynnema sp. CA-248983]
MTTPRRRRTLLTAAALTATTFTTLTAPPGAAGPRTPLRLRLPTPDGLYRAGTTTVHVSVR